MVCDFAHVGFTAKIPLPNQGFPARFLGILNNMKVPFPPVDERRAIITFLNAATSELGDGIETTMRQINTMS